MLGLALAIGSLFATGTTAALLAGASMVVGVYTAREQRKRAQRALERSIKDRTVMVRDATADRPFIYGRVRTSGQVQFIGSSGTYSDLLHFTLALGDKCDAVEAVWFNDASIGTLAGDGWTTTGTYYRSGTESTYYQAVVNASAQITLPHTVAAIQAVSALATGDTDPPTFTAGDPSTDQSAYSTATVGGVTVFTFNTAWIGQTLLISYTYTWGQPLARALAFLGGSGQTADPYLVQQLAPNWGASDKFTGTSYISGTLRYNQDAYPTGVPEVSAVVRGAQCYDPRTATTVWTRNPALIARHYIQQRFPGETFNDASLIAAANVCDESVEYASGQTHERYTFDDVISSDTSPVDGLERILQAMVGSAVRSAGVWYVWAGAWEEPTIALDETDLAPGEITVQGVAEDGVLFNGISGRYTNPDKWVDDSFPTYVSPAYVALDNDETEILDVDLTQITNVYRAQRVARLLLHKARQALTFSCTLEMSAYAVTPGTMVEWTIARYGWTAKAFRCVRRVYSPSTGTIQAVFQEDAEAIYSSTYSELTTPDPAPNTDLPDPLTVAAPDLSFLSGAQYLTVLSDGTQRPFLRVYWLQMDESVEKVELWWRRIDRSAWQKATVDSSDLAFDIYGVSRNEQYIVQGRAINGIGVRSAWTAEAVTMSESTPINGSMFVVGIGSNLHPNTRFLTTAEPWTYYHSGAGGSAVPGSDYASPPYAANERIGWAASGKTYASYRPAPYNGLVHVTTSGSEYTASVGTRYIYPSGATLPCQPGDRIEAQCFAGGTNGGGAKLNVRFFDASGSDVGEYGLSAPTPLGPSSRSSTLSWLDPETGMSESKNFRRIWGFVDAPTGAASAQLVIHPTRSVSSGTSTVSVSMPYLGLAHSGQERPSAWSVGPES